MIILGREIMNKIRTRKLQKTNLYSSSINESKYDMLLEILSGKEHILFRPLYTEEN